MDENNNPSVDITESSPTSDSTPSPSTITQPIPEQQKLPVSGKPNVILSFVVLILLCSTAYFAYQTFLLKSPSPKSQDEIAEIQAESTPPAANETTQEGTGDSSTADWKTYVNTAANYSIKYPKDWMARTVADGAIDGVEANPQSYMVDISPIRNTDEQPRNFLTIQNFDLVPSHSTAASIEDVLVNGYSAKKISYDTSDQEFNSVTYSIYSSDTKTVELLFRADEKSPNWEVFNQILSTFKFTGASRLSADEMESLSSTANLYLTALIENDRQTALSYLSEDVKSELDPNWPQEYSSYKIFEILNELHNDAEEEAFYNGGKPTYAVKFYKEGDQIGSLTSVVFIKEGGEWKTSSWNLFK